MSDYKGKEYLKALLAQKQPKVNKRYRYYEMKHIPELLGIAAPPNLRPWLYAFGWCAKAADSLADRIVFNGFKEDNFNLNEIFNLNNPDVLTDSAVLSALISSCAFIYISADEDGYPRMQVIDGGNATGVIDPITGLLNEGYAILEKDDNGNVLIDAYFTKEATYIAYAGEKVEEVYEHNANVPMLVPIIYRPDARRPFGHSRISRAAMSFQDGAARTLLRSEITAEFYSFPQKWVTGLSEDAEAMESWRASISSMLAFTKDEDGDKPVVGQFTQASMTPHFEQLKTYASMMAGETGLTLDDLGFATANPSSAEAIKAAHENLRASARKAQRTFGSGLLNVGYTAACLRDNYAYKRQAVYLTKPTWQPLFEPDAAMLSAIGDGAIKLNQAIPDYLTADNIKDLTGI